MPTGTASTGGAVLLLLGGGMASLVGGLASIDRPGGAGLMTLAMGLGAFLLAVGGTRPRSRLLRLGLALVGIGLVPTALFADAGTAANLYSWGLALVFAWVMVGVPVIVLGLVLVAIPLLRSRLPARIVGLILVLSPVPYLLAQLEPPVAAWVVDASLRAASLALAGVGLLTLTATQARGPGSPWRRGT